MVPFACGTDTVIRPVEPEIAEADLALVYAEALCDQRIECGCYDPLSGPAGEDPEAATRAQCVESRRLEIEHWQSQRVGLLYDGACAAKRLADMEVWGCDDTGQIAVASGNTGCTLPCRVYYGAGEQGDVCERAGDCGQRLDCIMHDDGSGDLTYICDDPCRAYGAPCSEYAQTCPFGSFCTHGAASEHCAPQLNVGDPCAHQYECAWPAKCVASDGAEVCTVMGENGAACDPAFGCLGTCVDGVCASGPAEVCWWDLRESG